MSRFAASFSCTKMARSDLQIDRRMNIPPHTQTPMCTSMTPQHARHAECMPFS